MKRRILVVDDFVHCADSLGRLLSRLSYDVRTAYDGLHAVAIAEEFKPEFILLDIAMPNFNGFETARFIRNKRWGRGMVLIAISAHSRQQDRRLSSEAGFDAHLTKPAQLTDILDSMEKASQRLENEPYIPREPLRA